MARHFVSQLVEIAVSAQDAPSAPRHVRDIHREVGNAILLAYSLLLAGAPVSK